MAVDNKMTVGLEITGNGEQVTQSVKSIKTELRQATQDAVNLSRKFGEFSPQALEAAQKVANLKDEIGDFKARVDSLNPDAKFRAFSSALQGVAGGFAGVQGAIGLFGTESAELEKQLLKVQSALALSEGINSILESKDAFMNLGSVIKTRVVTAFSTLRGAIIATGIGAFAVLLGTVVAYWDEISDAITGATKETKAYGDAQKETNKEIEKGYENLFEVENAFNAARDGAISKSEALDIYNQKLGDSIGKATTLEQAERIYKANSANYIKSITARATAQVLLAKASQAAAKAATGEDADLSFWDKAVVAVQAAVGGIGMAQAEVVKRQSINRQENQNEITLYQGLALKELEKASEAEGEIKKVAVANGTSIVKAGVKTQTAIKKEGLTQEQKDAEERKKQEEKEAQEKKELFEKNQKELQELNAEIAEENRLSKMSEFERDIEELTTEYNERLAKAKEFNVNVDAITEEYSRKISERQVEQDAKDLESAKKNIEAKEELDRIAFENKKKRTEETIGLLSNLGAIVGQQTAAGKALAIATALINTYQGASEALKEKSTLPAPFSTIARFAAAGAIIANGIRTVKQITAVKVPSGGGGGGGQGGSNPISGTAPVTAPIQQGVSVQQTAVTNGVNIKNTDAIKAYVVERDITDSQDRINKIKAAATFGG
jgi:hypothetical protein